MTELRSVNPRDLTANPDNPRKFRAFAHDDQQLVASIRAIGLIQPPLVREHDGGLHIIAGHRRVAAAIAADLPMIQVLVTESSDSTTALESLSENMVRVAMNRVDIWRAIEKLEAQGWQEQAIADALALTPRAVRSNKLLAYIHPPMLEAIAVTNVKHEHLATIAMATLQEQAQVWKKHKPRKGETANWYAVANALSKRRIPFSAAKFDDALAAQYGVVWEEDLFMPAGDENRYTTNVDGFFGAQQEWLEGHLPKNGVLLPQNDYGSPELPKKAQRVWGKPAKGDIIGHYLDPRTAEVETIAYRMPGDTKAVKGKGKGGKAENPAMPAKAPRPDVTQKGHVIIGALRTDALHEALRQDPASDVTLIALLLLALGGRNVSVQSPLGVGRFDREATWGRIVAGGVLTQDHDAIRLAAREMLTQTLSCRDGMSNSGIGALIAADTLGAGLRLPSMATEEFLSCLSRDALERETVSNGLRIETRVKDTRANMVSHFASATWVYPGATFTLSEDQIADIETEAKTFGADADAEDAGEAPSEGEDDGFVDYADAAD